MSKNAISPTREENYAEWYLAVIKAADLAEHSPVRGCMVIKPWGYSIWENIQRVFNSYFKKKGIQNAYFPLFIPLSFMEKEAEHVEGFAKECAVVTHHRLEKNKEGKLVPASELSEPLIVRPTSETIIGDMFAKWIDSYRDLPLKINQWANIVRWEMRTRLFLRTTEFLWQEGHTAHATRESAERDVEEMLEVYREILEDYLGVAVIKGKKTASERFPGAEETYAVEAMMQDKRALQAGTSHFLGQNFAKSSNIKFKTENGAQEYAWTTSWGAATRLIGALIMVHSDDDGLVLPPLISPLHVVVLPVLREDNKEVLDYCHSLASDLRSLSFDNRPLEVLVDERDLRGGEKKWSWVKKGVPVILEIGKRDIEKGSFNVEKRSFGKELQTKEQFIKTIISQLQEMQRKLFNRSNSFLQENIVEINSKEDFYTFFTTKKGGFALAYWSEDSQAEAKIKEDLNVSVRCIPLNIQQSQGLCVITNKPCNKKVIFAKAY